MNATQARKQFFMVLDLATKHGNPISITREGIPRVVIMSQDEYEGWLETMEIMSDTQLTKDIAEGMRDMKAGRVVRWESGTKKKPRRTR